MACEIRIITGSNAFQGVLNETETAGRVYDALPLAAQVSRWGDEIYFMTGIEAGAGDPMRDVLQPGELALWPPGRAFCIFWGPTPASVGDEPRAAGDVVPIGKITAGLERLPEVSDGQPIRIERVE